MAYSEAKSPSVIRNVESHVDRCNTGLQMDLNCSFEEISGIISV